MIYYFYIIPEIGILDWLSSIPNLENDILYLYYPQFREYYIGYLVPQIWEIIYYFYLSNPIYIFRFFILSEIKLHIPLLYPQ